MNRFSLHDRVALVTGASRGLGLAMATALGEAGATVVLNSRDQATLDLRAEELRRAGIAAHAAAFDVTDEAAAVDAVAGIAARHGRLDILINNAGSNHVAALADHVTAEFRRVIDLNLTSLFVLAREASKVMAKGGYGRIVNVSSIMGLIGRATIPGYVSSKHAVIGLTRALAIELAPQGITVNAIGPGYFPTEINTRLQKDEAFNAYLAKRTPMGRWGRPEELGPAVVFLASPGASYLTGQIIAIDGGLTASL